jgi:hypothetical protein
MIYLKNLVELQIKNMINLKNPVEAQKKSMINLKKLQDLVMEI